MQPRKRNRPWLWLADGLLLALLATALVRPLYLSEYLDVWSSIESTFISDARFLNAHWPHPGWQPNWYCGTRTDYVYPPALRYGTAALSRLRHVSTARSYHLYIALLYAIGIAGVYIFVRAGSGSRWIALWAATASMLISPAFLLFQDFRIDYAGVYYMPLRLGVLVRYGEGPHMSAFALLPFSLAAAWHGLRRGHPAQLAASALFAALAVANNFYGATALAHFFPILAWSVWLAERGRMVWLRAAAVAALAIALDAFWLTPSYIRITLENMRWVSSPGHAWSAALFAVVIAVYVALSLRLARGRPERAWPAFCLGSLTIFGLTVIGNQYFDFRVIGEPGRLIPELELVIFLTAGLLITWMARRGRWWKAAAVALALASLAPSENYVRHAWQAIPGRSAYRNRVEFIVSDWVHRNLPGIRTLATGSVRFWYNAWYDLPQLGGGSEQGLLNENTQWAQANAVANDDPAVSIAWLQAMGTGAVYVDDKNSTEIYHDWANPEKFEGKLEKLYDDRAGNRVYRVPRRYDPLARVVEAASIQAVAPNSPQTDYASLYRYVDAIERGPEAPLEFHRTGTDVMRIKTQLQNGQRLVVQETYDPAWKAYSGGRAVPVARDPIGFLLLDPGGGDHDILLRFETAFENRAGMVVSAVAAAAVLWMTIGQILVARSWARGFTEAR